MEVFHFISWFSLYNRMLCAIIKNNSVVKFIVTKGVLFKMKELRMIIRDLREDRDIKQKVIAEYLGVSQQTYSNYENGHREIPIWAVTKLSEYYKVSTDYLLGADTGYLGNTNLNVKYLGDITMHDVVYDIQKLNTKDRRDLLRYIKFLKNGEN